MHQHNLQDEPESTLGSKPAELRRDQVPYRAPEEDAPRAARDESKDERSAEPSTEVDWYGADLTL